jgi:predicted transcriptional regulator
MPATNPTPVLTKSQAACLEALRDGEKSKTYVAAHAKLGLEKANAALLVLAELGLARRSEMKTWRITPRGQKCRFKTTAEKSRIWAELGPGMQRVLDALDRPMRRRDLAKKLGVTVQCVHHHVVTFYARGHVRLGCPDQILFVVARIDDDTPLLSLHEERVLSAIPNDCATGIAKIRLAARLSERRVRRILNRLIKLDFIRPELGLDDGAVYALTAAGSAHPQRSTRARQAKLPPLPLRSDRVLSVLSAIHELRAVRIKDLRDRLRIPQDSMRALMQYLKRKEMVRKENQSNKAPYSLTEKGIRTLSEMTRRLAA